jgi:arsenite/tail-anchored protein-transporting ATPase
MSFDLAHSLSDSFGLDTRLFDQHQGLPFRVAENLDVQEINVPAEIDRHWGDLYQYMAMLFSSTGMSDVVAEEVAILPGMEDVISLMYINQYLREGKYDAIIVDCPPTGESLRFVNITSTLEWYMMKRYNIDRKLVKLVRPVADRFTDYQLPSESYFSTLATLFERIKGVEELLVNPKVVTVRFVTQPEKMVIRETHRAFMYFSLYGVTTDRIVINRVLPKSEESYYARWVRTQAAYVREIVEYFDPIPHSILPLFPDEVVGLERLAEVADKLYEGKDPLQSTIEAPPFQFRKEQEGSYRLEVKLPTVDSRDVELNRMGDDLIIQLGSFRRHVPLPQAVLRLEVQEAAVEEGKLLVHFSNTSSKKPNLKKRFA